MPTVSSTSSPQHQNSPAPAVPSNTITAVEDASSNAYVHHVDQRSHSIYKHDTEHTV